MNPERSKFLILAAIFCLSTTICLVQTSGIRDEEIDDYYTENTDQNESTDTTELVTNLSTQEDDDDDDKETTETPSPTTQQPCILSAEVVDKNDSSIVVLVSTNVYIESITCGANSTEPTESVLILDLLYDASASSTDANATVEYVVCGDLVPSYDYTILLPDQCILNEPFLTATTDFEELNCVFDEEVFAIEKNAVRVECERLRCVDCHLRFELDDLELNTTNHTHVVDDTSSTIEFKHSLDVDFCGLFRIEAVLSRNQIDHPIRTPIVYEALVFPTELTFNFSSPASLTDWKVTFEFAMDNKWRNCRHTQVVIEVKKPPTCDTPLSEETAVTLYEHISSLTYLETDVFEFNIDEESSNLERPITHWTNYSIRVDVEKYYDNRLFKRLNSSEIYQTDGYLAKITKWSPSTHSIAFEWDELPECVQLVSGSCVSATDDRVTEADLDESTRTAVCANLTSNVNYKLRALAHNKANTADDSNWVHTRVEAVSIQPSSRFAPHSLRLSLNLEFSREDAYESLRLYYRRADSIGGQFSAFGELKERLPNGTYVAEFARGELFFATTYRFRIEAIGCGGECADNSSDPVNITTDLDNFTFTTTPLCTSDDENIWLTVNSANLPFAERGIIWISCQRGTTFNETRRCEGESSVLCRCTNLAPGSWYIVRLMHTMEGFESPRPYEVGLHNTRIAKPILSSVSFDKNMLTGKFAFRQELFYEWMELCCTGKESPVDYTACFEIFEQTTSFTRTNLRNLDWGHEYECFVRTYGVSGNETSDRRTNYTDLDIIKVDPDTILITPSERELNLTFDKNSFPNGSYTDLQIQCVNENEAASAPRACIRDAERAVCRCNSNSLQPGTQYLVKLLTTKTSNYEPRVLDLRSVYTLPLPPRCYCLNQRENSLRIGCEIVSNSRLNGIRLRLKRDELNPTSLESDIDDNGGGNDGDGDVNDLVRLDTDRVCNYNPSAPSSLCELNNNQFYTNYTGLTPGTLYHLTARTFIADVNSSLNTERCATKIDLPGIRRLVETSQNRLRLEFTLPKTEYCRITFVLMEKDGRSFAYFEEAVYKRLEQQPNVFTDSITFTKSISSKYGVQYKVKAAIVKMFSTGLELREDIEFDEIFDVPFPDFLIAVIVIAGVLFFATIPAGYFVYNKYKSREAQSKTLIKPEHLHDILKEWDDNQNAGCEKEWKEINDKSSKFDHVIVGKEERNINKNRYLDILPYEHSRVKLATNEDDENENTTNSNNYLNDDYINANFIPGLKSETKYIACQAPLEKTIKDFWRMIWERYVSVVIMLANVYEHDQRCVYDEKMKTKGNKKCDQYWPEVLNKPQLYGEMLVTLTKIDEQKDYIVRHLIVETDDIKQNVTQYQYKAWPDKKCPKKESLYEFMQLIKKNTTAYDNRGPVVVHCSAGIGRTGTYLAIEPMMELINHKKPVDVFQRVLDMRQHRPKMVQNPVQYRFIYDFLAYCYEKNHQKPDEIELEIFGE